MEECVAFVCEGQVSTAHYHAIHSRFDIGLRLAQGIGNDGKYVSGLYLHLSAAWP